MIGLRERAKGDFGKSYLGVWVKEAHLGISEPSKDSQGSCRIAARSKISTRRAVGNDYANPLPSAFGSVGGSGLDLRPHRVVCADEMESVKCGDGPASTFVETIQV